jgi:putative hemolysin
MRLVLELAIIVILLLFNAVLAASELAIVSARKPRLRTMADDGIDAARRVLAIQEQPTRFLAAIQVGITLAGFFASAVGAVSLVDKFSGVLENVGAGVIANNSHLIALIVITVLLSFVSIIIGELTPKTIAIEHAETIAMRMAKPIDALSRISAPVIHLLTAASNVLIRALGGQGRSSLPSVTKPELLALLETAEDEGVVEEADASLVEEALNFGDIQVRSVMVPRVDVRTIEDTMPVRDAVEVFFETGYSRLPVVRDTPDHVLGILHVKDVYRMTWSDPDSANRPVMEMIRPAYFVPETKAIDSLLEELRAQRTHIAVVVDEYGGMAGVVTLEDVLEVLDGEISDEFDPGYEPVREVEPDVYDVDGRLSIHDLLDVLDIDESDLEETEAESVGGLISDKLGRIPAVGDRVVHTPLALEVLSMDSYRVALVRVTHVRPEQRDEAGELANAEMEESPTE